MPRRGHTLFFVQDAGGQTEEAPPLRVSSAEQGDREPIGRREKRRDADTAGRHAQIEILHNKPHDRIVRHP